MTNNEFQERSNQEQKTESNLNRRQARQKRVQRIVQILGFPSSGVGMVVTAKLLMSGDLKNAAIIGIVTFSVTIIVIAAKFISEPVLKQLTRSKTSKILAIVMFYVKAITDERNYSRSHASLF